MVFTPRSITVNESVPSSVVSLRVEMAIYVGPPTFAGTILGSQVFAAPSSYPANLDISSDAVDCLYHGVAPGQIVTYRVVEIGHDGNEVASPWSGSFVETLYSADGPESIVVNP